MCTAFNTILESDSQPRRRTLHDGMVTLVPIMARQIRTTYRSKSKSMMFYGRRLVTAFMSVSQ